MKKTVLTILVLLCTLIFPLKGITQAEPGSLGDYHVGVKVGVTNFTHQTLEDNELDTLLYLGFEYYGRLYPGLYIGFEGGYATTDGITRMVGFSTINTDLTYIPLEVNLKHVYAVRDDFSVSFGAGVSYNYSEGTMFEGPVVVTGSEWVFGWQVLADANYTWDRFYMGVNGKYKDTSEIDIGTFSLDSWQLGGTFGVVF